MTAAAAAGELAGASGQRRRTHACKPHATSRELGKVGRTFATFFRTERRFITVLLLRLCRLSDPNDCVFAFAALFADECAAGEKEGRIRRRRTVDCCIRTRLTDAVATIDEQAFTERGGNAIPIFKKRLHPRKDMSRILSLWGQAV